jgi:hypothetical protein
MPRVTALEEVGLRGVKLLIRRHNKALTSALSANPLLQPREIEEFRGCSPGLWSFTLCGQHLDGLH